MNLLRRGPLAALVAVVLLLAACAQEPKSTTPQGYVKLNLALAGDESLSSQGLPYAPTSGDIAVDGVLVTVRDRNGVVVSFDQVGATYTASTTGAADVVTLTRAGAVNGIAGATVVLPSDRNPYTFEARGYASATPAALDAVLAYSTQTQTVTDASTVWLSPTSVLGGAWLTPRFPTTYAAPGSILDLMLVVAANGHANPADYLQVPLGDFTAAYTAATGGSIIASSNMGVRLRVAPDCSVPVGVTSTVSGLVLTGGTFVAGSVPVTGANVACPPAVNGNVQVDVENPTVSLDSQNPSGLVVGHADDNFGIGKVQIYDGPALIASTDPTEVGGDVSLIVFVGGTTEFRTVLSVTPQSGIVAVALDTSGNQGTSEELVSFSRLYVNAAAAAGGTGSLARPLRTINEALALVADGGTIVVAGGTYVEQLEVTKSLSIEGSGAGMTILQFPASMQAVDVTSGEIVYAALDVRGAGVVANVSGLTVSGPFGTRSAGGNCGTVDGVRVKNATLNLLDSSIVDMRLDLTTYVGGSDCGASLDVGGANTQTGAQLYGGVANLTNVTFAGYQKRAIRVRGGSSVLNVTNGVFTGGGPMGVNYPAQNGVQAEYGSTANVRGSTFSGHYYTDPAWDAAGLLYFDDSRGIAEDNDFYDNNIGLFTDVPAGPVSLVNNRFTADATKSEWAIWSHGSPSNGELDATQGNVFNGVLPATATLDELFDIERIISHGIDGAGRQVVRVVPQNLYVNSDGNAIGVAVLAAKAGDTINLEDGNYVTAAPIVVPADKPFLKLVGSSYANTTVTSTAAGPAPTAVIDVRAAGAEVSGLAVRHTQVGNVTGVNVGARNVVLRALDIALAGDGTTATSNLGAAVRAEANTDVSGMQLLDLVIHDVTYGVDVENGATLRNALFENMNLRDVTWKGIYLESFGESVMSKVSMDNVGWLGGPSGSGNEGKWGAGIDINLKNGIYGNVVLDRISATNTGWSYGVLSGSSTAVGTPGVDSDPNGAAIAIRARNDGGYAANPGVLTGVSLSLLEIDNALVGVRFGEPGKDNEHGTATIVDSTIGTDPGDPSWDAKPYAVVNWSVSDVEAFLNNTFTPGEIWDKDDNATRGAVRLTP